MKLELVSLDPPEYKVSFDHSCSEQQLSVYQPPVDSTQGKPPPFKNRYSSYNIGNIITIAPKILVLFILRS